MQCLCGCEQETRGGKFMPGHDQVLRSQLERKVGGLEALSQLVDAAVAFVNGQSSAEQFALAVRGAVEKDQR